MNSAGSDIARFISSGFNVVQKLRIIFLVGTLIFWAAGGYSFEVGDAKTSARVNLRKSPSLNGEILNTIPMGHTVRIVQTKGLWCRVDVTGEINKRGWVFGRYIEQILPKALPARALPLTAKVETEMRKSPRRPPSAEPPPRFFPKIESGESVGNTLQTERMAVEAASHLPLQGAPPPPESVVPPNQSFPWSTNRIMERMVDPHRSNLDPKCRRSPVVAFQR